MHQQGRFSNPTRFLKIHLDGEARDAVSAAYLPRQAPARFCRQYLPGGARHRIEAERWGAPVRSRLSYHAPLPSPPRSRDVR